MIDLTLDSILIPDITGYVNPWGFGTKITRNPANKGGLSTREVNNNIISSFVKMRGIAVSADETTKERIEYDAKLYINSDRAITLNIKNATYSGCILSIFNMTQFNHSLICSSVSQNTPILQANTSIELIWNGSAWQNISAPSVGMYVEQYPAEKPPELIYPCTRWTEVQFNGAFFRAYKNGVSGDFSEENDPLSMQLQSTSKNRLTFTDATEPGVKPNKSSTGDKTVSYTASGSVSAHSHYMNFNTGNGDSGGTKGFVGIKETGTHTFTERTMTTASSSISLSGSIASKHKHTFTPKGSINSDDIETRPINYTIKIWKRIA